MKITYLSKNNRITLEVEAKDQTDVFKQLASFQEVFEEFECGACNGDSLRFAVRSVEENEFFELHCTNPKCRARLAFGQHKKGGSLFPRRKDENGKWFDKGGWLRWNPETKKEE